MLNLKDYTQAEPIDAIAVAYNILILHFSVLKSFFNIILKLIAATYLIIRQINPKCVI